METKSDEELKQIFAKNLNDFLEYYGKTQQEVATAIGVFKTTFNTWTRGVSIPRIDKLEKLADYFHVSKSELLEGKSENGKTADDAVVKAVRNNENLHNLVSQYMRLDEGQQALVVNMIEQLSRQNKRR